jgi:hypothetical protein
MADWSKITLNNDQMTQPGTFNPDEGSCDFPSAHVVEIFYQKIGTKESPQYIMNKIQHGQVK